MTDGQESFFLTEAELTQLVGMTPGVSAARSADALGIAGHVTNADVRRAGIQTLLVRGLATLSDGDLLQAQGNAHAVGAMLGQATDWLVLSVEGENVRAFTTLVASPVGNLTIALSPTGVHELTPLDPALPLTEPLRLLIGAYVDDETLTKPLLVRVRHLLTQEDVGVRITMAADGTWTVPVSALQTQSGAPADVWPHVTAALYKDERR